MFLHWYNAEELKTLARDFDSICILELIWNRRLHLPVIMIEQR